MSTPPPPPFPPALILLFLLFSGLESFSTTMNALVRAGKCDGALAVFREMISRKLEPGLVACNFVLTNCSKHKKGEVALEFLEVMRKVRGRKLAKTMKGSGNEPRTTCLLLRERNW